MYEYKILEQVALCWPVETPWAFPASFACVQTPANRLIITGGIGDEETNRRTIEVLAKGSPHSTFGDDPEAGFFGLTHAILIKEAMINRRINHSLCYLTDQFLFATGSYTQTE